MIKFYKLPCPAKAPTYRRVFLTNFVRSILRQLLQDISALLKVTYGWEVELTEEKQNRNLPTRGVDNV